MILAPGWIDLILFGVLLEALVLGVWVFRRRPGLSLSGLLANLLAGACLLLALRFALTEQPLALLIALTGALVAHLADLRLRLAAD